MRIDYHQIEVKEEVISFYWQHACFPDEIIDFSCTKNPLEISGIGIHRWKLVSQNLFGINEKLTQTSIKNQKTRKKPFHLNCLQRGRILLLRGRAGAFSAKFPAV